MHYGDTTVSVPQPLPGEAQRRYRFLPLSVEYEEKNVRCG